MYDFFVRIQSTTRIKKIIIFTSIENVSEYEEEFISSS